MSTFTDITISEYWLPSGVLISLAFSYLGFKPGTYSEYLPFAIVLLDVLIMYMVLWNFFAKNGNKEYSYSLVNGPPRLAQLLRWQANFGVLVFGWLVGDLAWLLIGSRFI